MDVRGFHYHQMFWRKIEQDDVFDTSAIKKYLAHGSTVGRLTQGIFTLNNILTIYLCTGCALAKYTYLSLVFPCLLLHWTFVFILKI